MSADEGRPIHETVDERIDGEVLSNHPGREGRRWRWKSPVVALASLLVLPLGLTLHGARSSHADSACGRTTACEKVSSLLRDVTVVATLHDYCPRLRRLRAGDLDIHLLVGGGQFSLDARGDQRARVIGIPAVGDRVRGLVEVRCPLWACTTPELRPIANQVPMIVIR
jgi:hypothetical protein